MLNKFGKTLTIFAVLIVILLISSTSIGFYLYNQETQQRKSAEGQRDSIKSESERLQAEVVDLKKQMALLQDRNKEADEKINNLLDEKDLNEGLRSELKKENASLKEQVDILNKLKDKMKADYEDSQSKVKQFQEMLKTQEEKAKQLQERVDDLEATKQGMETKIGEMKSDMLPYNKRSPKAQVDAEIAGGIPNKDHLDLDKIVVNPQDGVKGRILSFDKEAEFIVCNLGLKQGVKSGDFLSVYRGDEYLGDAKVTRVQEEMSAADIVPPFSSRKVRKNDIVFLKQ